MSQQTHWDSPAQPTPATQRSPLPSNTMKALAVFGALFFAVMAWFLYATTRDRVTDGTTSHGGSNVVPGLRQYTSKTCAETSGVFGTNPAMVDGQQAVAWRDYENRWVRWLVNVEEVRDNYGRLEMRFRCNAQSPAVAGQAHFDDAERTRLFTLPRGTPVQIEGRLDAYHPTGGLTLENAVVTHGATP